MNPGNFFTSLILIALASLAPSPSLAQTGMGSARVMVCNRGQININVVIGTQAALPLFNHDLIVTAWTAIDPGTCRQVYHGTGDAREGSGIERSYIGVGFYGPQGQLIAGHASRLPDFGIYSLATPVITAAKDRFCVRSTAFAPLRSATGFPSMPSSIATPSASVPTIPADIPHSPPHSRSSPAPVSVLTSPTSATPATTI